MSKLAEAEQTLTEWYRYLCVCDRLGVQGDDQELFYRTIEAHGVVHKHRMELDARRDDWMFRAK